MPSSEARILAQPIYVGGGHASSATAFTCPKCNLAAQAGLEAQHCGSCGTRFLLLAGPAADPNVHPPPVNPNAKTVKVKTASAFVLFRGTVQADAIAHGPLDPVTGLVPISENAICYPAIESIAVWRKIDWSRLVVALVLLPLGLWALAASLSTVGWLVVALPVLALGGFVLYRAVGLRANFMRVVSRDRCLKIRFDQPMWRRMPFLREALVRSGLPADQVRIP